MQGAAGLTRSPHVVMEDAIRIRELQARAKRLLQNGANGESLEVIDLAIREQPDNADSHAIRGAALNRLGRGEESRAAFEHAVLLAPNEARHRFNLASQLRSMGLVDEALEAAEQAKLLDPDLPQLRELLEDLRSATPSYADAERPAGAVDPAPSPADTEPEPLPPVMEPAPSAEAAAAEPPTIQKWNWGAFWLTGLWAISHRLYVAGIAIFLAHIVSLLVYGVIAVRVIPPIVEHQVTVGTDLPQEDVERIMAPYAIAANVAQLLGLASLAAAIWFGASGNRWAWRARPFRDVDHFFAVQRLWAIWAWVAVGVSVLLSCLFFIVIIASAASQLPVAPDGAE